MSATEEAPDKSITFKGTGDIQFNVYAPWHHLDEIYIGDGGINPETIHQTYDQGARIFVAASAIFKHPQGIQAGIESLTDKL